ncbi:unnamed protein product [Ectocarpus sp. CCAP 1310/34]|nr:unnamed protein product [Ectocarpus sp. CCAP 1310/34]
MLPCSAALPASYGARDAGAAGAFAGYPVQAHPVQQQQQQTLTTSPPPETQVYVPAVLKANLEAVQTEGKTLEDVEEEVVRLCAGEGAILSTAKSTSLDTAPGVLRRNVKGSARTGCPFEVSVRHAKTHRWPKISNMKLKHNHSVDRNAIDVQVRLASKLTEEQLGQVKQMTSHGMKPKEVTKAMKALHEDGDIDINKRAVQNAAATVRTGRRSREMPPMRAKRSWPRRPTAECAR